MTTTVRRAELADANRIAELHVITWQEAYSDLLPADFFTADHTREREEMWNRILTNPRDEWAVRIAERDGHAVGFAMSGPSFGTDGQDLPRDRQLYCIYVLQDAHGTGIGQALLDAALGGGPAMLWVAKENPRAIAFYRRNGFKLDGVEQKDPGAPRITDARMVR
jgi:ribosomal protein S18 acetylase RimI-like enzyme